LDFFQYRAYIHALVPRVACPAHGVRTVPMSWARPGSGFTLLFEAMVVELAETRPVADVAAQVGEHDTRPWRFIRHYVGDVIACGTSYHAGLIAKNLIEGWARIPTEVEAASEFRYRNPIITPTTLVVAVSQSGETADTLAAIRDARIKGAKVFGITNVVGSPVARESDGVIYTKANKEIAVASTKSFIGQVVSLTLLALLLAQVKYRLTTKQTRMMFRELSDTAEQIQWILDTQTEAVHEAALLCKDAQSALFVGRGMGAAISYEGALKLKEVSYLHAEAYAAGEMKHGPIALIDPGFPVIAVATKSATYDKTVSNLMECKARGAKVIVVATEGDEEINKIADCIIRVPAVRDVFSPITASVPLQLLAREVAILRGCDVDQPRNLAKSVTVE